MSQMDSDGGDGAPAGPAAPPARAPLTRAREVASRALVRVWQKDAFASAALDAELYTEQHRGKLDPRDAALATELTYGVLRVEPALLAKLAKVSTKFRAPTGLVRAHLLIGAYAICFLDRVPSFAAVSEAVEAARRVADPKVGGFVNAVLRRLVTDVEKNGPPRYESAVVQSCPAWLKKAIGRSIGTEYIESYLMAGGGTPPLGLCLSPELSRDEVIERLRKVAPNAEIGAGAASPLAVLVRGAGDLRRLAGLGESFIAQEEGAQVVALALGARPGERVLDACAGHGNKTWVLGKAVGPEGFVAAADLYAGKLRQVDLPTASGRAGSGGGAGGAGGAGAGAAVTKTFVVDWSKGQGEVPRDFDRALVDAPCSGTGTLRRRPEIQGKRAPEDLPRLAALQLAILRSAAACVRNGGRVVYAVCSVLREEAEEVVAAAAREGAVDGARLVPAPFDAPSISARSGEEAAFRLLPHVDGTDGYFAASFVVERG